MRELLLEGGHTDFAVSQTYYGFFYVAEALLLTEGLQFSRHGQVAGEYGRLFAKTGELDPRYHRLLIGTFGVRQTATYDAGQELPSHEEVTGYIGRSSPRRDHIYLAPEFEGLVS